jgi:hypothetical protein
MTIYERLAHLAAERERLAGEEAQLREEALAELNSINEKIEEFEIRKEQLEALLGIADSAQRAGHGQIQQLCLDALIQKSTPMTSGQIKDYLEPLNPSLRLTSVPSTLSRLVASGKLQRDERGRYFLA